MERHTVRRAAAEFVGTFALVFVGVGAIAATGDDLLAVALAHGLVIAVMASAVGHISGGHFNPAVTLAFLVTRRMAPSLAVAYWVTQLAAAAFAALVVRWLVPGDDATLAGVPHAPDFAVEGVVLEAILTFFLVWVIFATAADPGGAFTSIAGLAIGLTITFDILIGGPLTGAAMNPARAFGPQLVEGFWGEGWIYYVGPPLGAVAAGLAYQLLYLGGHRIEPIGTRESGLEEPRPGEAATR